MVTVNKVHTLTGHKDAVYTLQSGLQPHIVYSSGGDGQVIEWNLADPDSARLKATVGASVYAMKLITTHELLVVAQNYDGIHVIDVANGKAVGSLKIGNFSYFDIAYKNDLLFVAASDGTIKIIDFKSLQVVDIVRVADQNIRTVIFDAQDNLIVGASDGGIRVVHFGALAPTQEIAAHDKSVFSLATTPDQQTLISAGRDARLKFWDIDGLHPQQEIIAHMYAINSIALRPDGACFATASMDKTVKIWDLQQRKLLKVIDKARHGGHLTSVNKVVWTGYRDYLVSCSDDRSLAVWDVDIAK